jgi:hypothetical protein
VFEFPPSRRISPRSAALSLAAHAAFGALIIAVFAAPPPQIRVRPFQVTLIAPVLDPKRPPIVRHELPPPPPPQPSQSPAPRIQSAPPRVARLPESPRPKPAAAPILDAPRELPRVPAPAPELARTSPALAPPVITGAFEAHTEPVPAIPLSKPP